MKKILTTSAFALAAIIAFSSCTKERTYLCTITTYTPRGISAKPSVRTVPYTGSYTDMRAFEAMHTTGVPNATYNDAPYGSYETCTCK